VSNATLEGKRGVILKPLNREGGVKTMGYTHYWYRPEELDVTRFSLAVDTCRKTCDALPVPLAGWDGKGEPEFTDERVSFNGCEAAARNLSFAKVAASARRHSNRTISASKRAWSSSSTSSENSSSCAPMATRRHGMKFASSATKR
jgi:hypothetical protein